MSERQEAYLQNDRGTVVDRFGVWLSARQIQRYAGPFDGKSLGDFGCGYHAQFVRRVLPVLGSAVIVDSALADDLKKKIFSI